MSTARRTRRLAAAGAALAALVVGPTAAFAGGGDAAGGRGATRGCARSFDVAQRTDMESFRDHDAETWRSVHTDEAVSILTDGTVLIGIDEIMAAMSGHFEGRQAIWSWTEISRQVYGCDSAYILYETVYELPAINLRIEALTGVSYTFERGRWLAYADQGTPHVP